MRKFLIIFIVVLMAFCFISEGGNFNKQNAEGKTVLHLVIEYRGGKIIDQEWSC